MKTAVFAMTRLALSEYAAARSRADANQLKTADRPISTTGYRLQGSDAVIPIKGVLMNDPTVFDVLFGFAPELTYTEIASAVSEAEQDPNVQRIVFDVNSPGGYVDGIEEAVAAVAQARKPTLASALDAATSGAYWIASQAKKIDARSRTTALGSIGVATVAFKEPGVYEIASSLAPNKRPDPSTDQGRAAIQAELDGVHAIFAADVARGRGLTVDSVNEHFGKGGVLLAEQALSVGMIDEVNFSIDAKPTQQGRGAIHENAMTPAEYVAKWRGESLPEGWTDEAVKMAEKLGLTRDDIRKYGAAKGDALTTRGY